LENGDLPVTIDLRNNLNKVLNTDLISNRSNKKLEFGA